MSKMTATPYRATSITRSITPAGPVELGASDASAAPWQGIDSDIEVNVLALWGPDDEAPILLITLDLLYPGQEIRSAVESAAHRVPPERIVVAASHTHRAPMTDATKPALGSPNEGYMAWLTSEVSSAVKCALELPPVRVSVSVGETNADHSINRRLRKRLVVARRPRFNDVVNAPNPRGRKDERLTAMVLKTEDGAPKAVIWNYACHPVGGPVRNAVSSHFPGVVRDRIRAELSARDLPVLFLQGFSGDVRPNASARVHSLRRRLRRIVSGRLFEDMTRAAYDRWCKSLGDAALRAIDAVGPDKSASLAARRLVMPASRIAYGPLLGEVTIGRLSVGDLLTIYTVSGEPVVDYALRLREQATSRFVFCVGCTDHVIGYVPTRDIQAEGGYEGGGFTHAFNLDGLSEDVEDVILDAFRVLDVPARQGLPTKAPRQHSGTAEDGDRP